MSGATFCGLRESGALLYARGGDAPESGTFGTNIASMSVGAAGACALSVDGKPTCAIGAVADVQFRELAIVAGPFEPFFACGLSLEGVVYCWDRDALVATFPMFEP